MNSILTELMLAGRILLACACGAAIGLERAKRLKDAGIRTHIVVALGAALMMILSKYGFQDVIGNGASVDVSRVAANIITGITFLGAGVIFVKDQSIRGLTTAAGLWLTSAIGMAIGGGMVAIGVFSTVLLILLQLLLHRFASGLEGVDMRVTLADFPDARNAFLSRLETQNVKVLAYKLEKRQNDTVSFVLTVKLGRNVTLNDVMSLADTDTNVMALELDS